MAVQHTADEIIAELFADYLSRVDDDTQRAVTLGVLGQVREKYPELGVHAAWDQPMSTLDGTFVIGFSYARKRMAIAPERAGIEKLSDKLGTHGLSYGKMMVHLPWPRDGKAESMSLDLLAKMIEFDMEDKCGVTKFWRQVRVNYQPGSVGQLQCQLVDAFDDLRPRYSPIDALQRVHKWIAHRQVREPDPQRAHKYRKTIGKSGESLGRLPKPSHKCQTGLRESQRTSQRP